MSVSENPDNVNRNVSFDESQDDKSNTEGLHKIKGDLPLAYKSIRRIDSLIKTWTDVSKINYLPAQPIDVISQFNKCPSTQDQSHNFPEADDSQERFVPIEIHNATSKVEIFKDFKVNMTPLLDEGQLWGCFYIFPELYADAYSPVVHVKDQSEADFSDGILTRNNISPYLSYLKRIPILGDYVFIKLELPSKNLVNIDILEHYKFLVYLDISSNYLTELKVLSHLRYLQYLTVAYNRLDTVLEYNTPQYFLTEVHYKFNSVKRIRDISTFWSITILDLSHNNIKAIAGLETLRYLRRLDLSFNHIQRLENLNNLRLLWLDVSYNNISSFEFGPQTGLWTLIHLEYLNLNENNLSAMKIFSGLSGLRELHVRNNRFSVLLDLAVYMRRLTRLTILDFRGNPICDTPGYKDVVINNFMQLLNLDAVQLDPVEQRTAKMEMFPDVNTIASRRLLRLLYIELASSPQARVPPFTPPADTTEVPIVVLVGYEGVGKGSLARRLASECSAHIELGLQHTTATTHYPGHYITVTRDQFDNMIRDGQFLTYCEKDGESYGLSREQAFINAGRVKLVCLDLVSALMLKLRGRRPYLILTFLCDEGTLAREQEARRWARQAENEKRSSDDMPSEWSALQVLLSGRIIIRGILNEILCGLPDQKEQSEFVMGSECSIMMNSGARREAQSRDYAKGDHILTLMTASDLSLEEANRKRHEFTSQLHPSMQSLYKEKESQGTGEYLSFENDGHCQDRMKKSFEIPCRNKHEKSSAGHPKSVDFTRYTSSTWKGFSMAHDSIKSSKTVTFTSGDADNAELSGMLIDPPSIPNNNETEDANVRSFSMRGPWAVRTGASSASRVSQDEDDLWFAFLAETGAKQFSDLRQSSHLSRLGSASVDDVTFFFRESNCKNYIFNTPAVINLKYKYENIHRENPGLFWDTVPMDNANEAFKKVKKIIRSLVKSQPNLTPMFDINFLDQLEKYPNIAKRVEEIRKEIAPHRLFF